MKPGASEVGGCSFRDRGVGGDEGHQQPLSLARCKYCIMPTNFGDWIKFRLSGLFPATFHSDDESSFRCRSFSSKFNIFRGQFLLTSGLGFQSDGLLVR